MSDDDPKTRMAVMAQTIDNIDKRLTRMEKRIEAFFDFKHCDLCPQITAARAIAAMLEVRVKVLETKLVDDKVSRKLTAERVITWVTNIIGWMVAAAIAWKFGGGG